jgi:CRISPR-associated protein Csd1
MILQELVRYYERQAANPDSQIAPIGLEWKEISFAIVIDRTGNFQDIEDLRTGDKKPRGRAFLVPQAVKRTVKIEAQLLWDNLGYVLGYDDGDSERAAKEHEAFAIRTQAFAADCPNDMDLTAVCSFLSSNSIKIMQSHKKWQDLVDSKGNISFRLVGEQQLVCDKPALQKAAQEIFLSGDSSTICCLATGQQDKLKRLHDSIKGVYGAQSSGASIVSFNRDAFRSFNKEQGANAPVGVYAATAYTTALNSLLDRQSRQRLQLGETSVIFWCEKSHKIESLLFDLFGEPPKDDPSLHTQAVGTLYKARETGVLPFEDDQTKFFVLGLGPNAARIAIRFWHSAPISAIAKNIRQYFSDVDIVRPKWAAARPTLMSLLRSTALRNERENITPSLPAYVLKAILDGTPFPITVASAVIRRIRAEQNVTYYRAALLKAFLNRQSRAASGKEEDEMTLALDESNRNVGYNLGRLFAALEKIQAEALGDINASIRDRYYASASATPVTSFPILMRLKNHHLSKLTNKGRAVNLEKRVRSIVERISDFPAHLSLADQGRFAIGYYHQQQSFFDKTEAHVAPPLDHADNTLVEA